MQYATLYLLVYPVPGVLGLAPLFCWLVGDEPFVGPWKAGDILRCVGAVWLGLGWLVWWGLHLREIARDRAPAAAVLAWCLPVFFGGASFLFAYLYLHDRGVL